MWTMTCCKYETFDVSLGRKVNSKNIANYIWGFRKILSIKYRETDCILCSDIPQENQQLINGTKFVFKSRQCSVKNNL